ncbi:putative cupin superfamily protein [Parabacteroides sp. PF5-5]|uniref:cupin domain-containing protein n=1 Tax=unclassified Parabacteroides TaxID=2649774 RepID=UPI0024746F27|nr:MULTISPECIES: cupin domain-containing protein [unclassified Parabacteroides]MDH6306810.1 putative cupin superfamily protein [Parabacteroides sp. PH5-39]MDH6316255.1 putative cupin superfamily protein [Parabacteroides sp. PF5-13]MDH6319738.1 putative cupin superfamily protein [Parabacteroides sp. PH5-13]MDH6323670.1 putative cupin superfamily protein [Parabacteroides sp. PH5-8]MDH6327442.1 putative cupin superfamily protein [Parabacteroides sp. PH5-41]
MATILKSGERNFKENPNRVDHFKLFTDMSRVDKGVEPENLNFDVRRLDPGEFCSAYHFHRYAEELFVMLSGSATLRTPKGLEIVKEGDLIFFEKGETGAHQLYNHTIEPCTYLDIRTFIGYDVCEYPDSNKIYLAPSAEIFRKDSTVEYFAGEKDILDVWKELKSK